MWGREPAAWKRCRDRQAGPYSGETESLAAGEDSKAAARAPAPARADVDIAIGTGTDVAIETTDLTLMAGSLGGLVTVITLSRATIGNIRQNLFLAIGHNAAGIPIAAGAEQRQPAAPFLCETGVSTDADRRSARAASGRDYREFVTTTVLVVDDERKLRNLLRDYLEREGYVVLEAADGQAALDLGRAPGPGRARPGPARPAR